jgi:hypothetical protein
MAKTLYHSSLVKMGPVEVTVKSDGAIPSKFKGKNPFVVLEIDGEEHTYNTENEDCASFFNGTKGRTFTIVAEGREGDAIITYVGESAEAPEPAKAPAKQAPKSAPARPVTPPARPVAKPSQPAQPPQAEPEAPEPAEPPKAQAPASRAYDFVDDLINARRFLARRGNGLRLAANESLRVIEGFRKEHGLPFDGPVKAGIVQNIAEHMTQTIFTTLFIALDRSRRPGDVALTDTITAGNLDQAIAFAKQRIDAGKTAA